MRWASLLIEVGCGRLVAFMTQRSCAKSNEAFHACLAEIQVFVHVIYDRRTQQHFWWTPSSRVRMLACRAKNVQPGSVVSADAVRWVEMVRVLVLPAYAIHTRWVWGSGLLLSCRQGHRASVSVILSLPACVQTLGWRGDRVRPRLAALVSYISCVQCDM